MTRGQANEVNRILQQQQALVPDLNPIPDAALDTLFGELDRSFTKDFEDFLGLKANQDLSFEDVQRSLRAVRAETGVKPAIIYFFFSKTNSDPDAPKNNQAGRAAVARSSQFPSPDDQLEILIILETGEPIRQSVAVSRREVVSLTNRLRSEITAYRTSPRAYLAPSQQLYKWLIAPIEKDLQDKEIDNLNFILDQGLRSLPIAALHDGEKFLVEKYSLAMMPSLNLTDLRYRDIKTAPILAMGATTFTDNNPLPAVGLELAEISKGRGNNYFLNDQFTTTNLRQQHQQQGRQILHLATHGTFQGDSLNDSYIQLWDRRLTLGELPELGLSTPVIDLLVLSACQTALGNRQAELGFAGLAVQAGVRSSMASLWEVSDEATLGLMTNFYDQLTTAPIKAEALRRTQLAMLGGSVRLESGNLISETRSTPLTRELAALGDRNFRHPYFWSAFTLVGNPW
ncbi:MAG: CHAT domain-containing protein [Coleofasciculaceae cyanobacterium SM2_1_6]|nr:CHAT domain-containing protein [Coleofasciculaceae cyanobacterium SM2_1_6]